MSGQLLLTFDVEDFINDKSMEALFVTLKLLEKHNLKGLFFITGHVAEKLRYYHSVLNLLLNHEIGFHSSAHSVHPTIFEYCDVEAYEDAVQTSIERETSHINPLTGETEQSGGIYAIRGLFPSKNIMAYRAPGYCCPPPHLEAMLELGLKYDFSWNFSNNPVSYKGITFYPRPIFPNCEKALLTGKLKVTKWMKFLCSINAAKMTILSFHPNLFVNKRFWDGIFHKGNPAKLSEVPSKDAEQTRTMFATLEMLLRTISYVEKLRIISTSPCLTISKTRLDVARVDLGKVVEAFAYWPRTFFAYEPKHINSQLLKFLGTNFTSS